MRLQTIYKADIDRKINGVIKAAQNDEQSVVQELSEYIITRELHRHFVTFLRHYAHSLEQPTDQIGVWISGFFGSGKSHFLKILSCLLSDPEAGGRRAVDYFADKFEDPALFGQLRKCADIPTETILFNIDAKSPLVKDKTAILRVFAKVFYEHQGFCGSDLRVAKLEQFLAGAGKTEEFRENFARISGKSWEASRDSYVFYEDAIIAALSGSLAMSETAARSWFHDTAQVELSIEQLVNEIKEYIDSRSPAQRLLFMVDEVGQYIGSDPDLMLNLQTIVEEIGAKCGGRVWVMVTSQESIDGITDRSGADFSKIQGRFHLRLSLSSSSVDEVIKKRLLAKTDDAADMLRLQYEQNCQVLRNLFTFKGTGHDLKGYAGETDFVETYPFVPYQFRLMQNVLAQIRKHGNSGKDLSGGERSMLSGFQEAAQAIRDRDEFALVPFDLFYDTLHTFLEGSVRDVIDRCQNAADKGDGITSYDVRVFKLLYLIRYTEEIRANAENISILMADDIRTDQIACRLEIQQSLDRLAAQNYISRSGDTYTFLTSEEQTIALEIRNTPVDSALITKAISDILFGTFFAGRKLKYDGYDFPFDRYVDETSIGQEAGSVRLQFITAASEIDTSDDAGFRLRSQADNAVIVVLAERYPYYSELENAMKIRRYCKSKNAAQLPERIRSILRRRQSEAAVHEKRAEELLAEAILEGRIYAAGDLLTIGTASVKERITQAMSRLIESVYTKLGFIRKHFDSDAEILALLNGADAASPNAEAGRELYQYLELRNMQQLTTSMGDVQRHFQAIPYGWRGMDISAVTAVLIASQKLTLQYGGAVIAPTDEKLPEYLHGNVLTDQAVITLRAALPTALLRKTREFLSEYCNCTLGAIPDDEDGLTGCLIDRFETGRQELQALLEKEYSTAPYPGKSIVEQGVRLCDALLMHREDRAALLKQAVEMQDDLLDHADDIADVKAFFRVQRGIFDQALAQTARFRAEKEYFQTDEAAIAVIGAIRQILALPKPYKRISELPALLQKADDSYRTSLSRMREEVVREIAAAMADIRQTADPQQEDIVRNAEAALAEMQTAAGQAEQLTQLDTMRIRVGRLRERFQQAMLTDTGRDVIALRRDEVCTAVKLESETEIDAYVAEIRRTLLDRLEGHDTLHII